MPTAIVAPEDTHPARTPTHAVHEGNCVQIAPKHCTGAPDNKGGVGFVTNVSNDGTFEVRWMLGNRGESGIRTQRILSLNPLATTA